MEKRVKYLDTMKSDNEQLNTNINEGLYQVPNQNQMLQVYVSTVNKTETLCTANNQWTDWRSAFDGIENDFETLLHHRKKF